MKSEYDDNDSAVSALDSEGFMDEVREIRKQKGASVVSRVAA